MSEYALKLAALSEKEKKLVEEKNKILEKRKKEIAELAEKTGLLLVSNELLAGAFAEIAKFITANDSRVKQWEEHGGKFLNSKRPAPSKVAESKRPARQDT